MKLSPEAQAEGWTGLTLSKQIFAPHRYGPFLEEEFFDGKSAGRWLLSPLLFGAAAFLLLYGSRAKLGFQTGDEERHGRRTKGPELVSPLRWKLTGKADGIRFSLAGKWGLPGPGLRVPRALESSHILLMGDTGSGKSNAIRQILRQVEARGETAVVYDPAGEFAAEFYRPERGDFLLNPLDRRCPEWSLAAELTGRGMEYAIAAAMLPEKEHGNDFFTEAPRRVLARLLHRKPLVSELLRWMADPEEIERRVEGTPEAAYIDRKAGPQRGGVLASLNLIADSLALLPVGGELFRTESWNYERTRWVFLTSRPSVRERLLPLHSVWLDLLILRMMEPCVNPGAKPVWFVLDELASLNKLPQLHTAVTENRKYGNPVVLGFQGRSQLEKRYGRDAEAMLSQPATKIFFKTSEPRAAKWISETLGEIEVERIRESRSVGERRSLLFGRQRQSSYSMEISTKPLVMASEIAGLEPLRGYVKQENRVVPVKVALTKRRSVQPEFIERKFDVPEPRPVPELAAPTPPQPTLAAALPFKPAQLTLGDPATSTVPKRELQPERAKSPFGKKRGTGHKEQKWDVNQWIE